VVTAELDAGPLLGQVPVAILPSDDPDSLSRRVLMAEYQLYPRMLADYVAREKSPEWLVAQVRERALALPEASEILSHGMPCFGIEKGKKFAYVSVDHHGDGKTSLLVKISGPDEQVQLIENDPDRLLSPGLFRRRLGRHPARPRRQRLGRHRRLAPPQLARVAPKKLTGADGRGRRVLTARHHTG
jgi:phosphoribosylglycinamide formyltransferase-1